MTRSASEAGPRPQGLRRVVLGVLIFLAVGEVVVRFDQATAFFRSSERLVSTRKETPLLLAVADGRFHASPRELRVLLVGDSYLYGAGVAAEAHFTERLKQDLETENLPGYHSAQVLDATLPGANTYENSVSFATYVDAFAPQVVILAYNANDVYGRQGSSEAVTTGDAARETAVVSDDPESRWLDVVGTVRRAVFLSHLMKFVIIRANMELKLAGYVVPGTEFDHQVSSSHQESFEGWRRSQVYLRHMAAVCRERKIRLMAVNVPQLNMLENYQVFGPLDERIAQFFRGAGVEFVDGRSPFVGQEERNFAISRYDGHPNAAAHEILADEVHRQLVGR